MYGIVCLLKLKNNEQEVSHQHDLRFTRKQLKAMKTRDCERVNVLIKISVDCEQGNEKH